MKRFIVLLCFSLAVTVCAFAHPGNTDSNGGHYNRTTGEYHYHHGNPAHQHVNGFCPYATVTPTPRATPKPTPKATAKPVSVATLPPSVKATSAPSSSKSSEATKAVAYGAAGSVVTASCFALFKLSRKI